MPRHSMRAWADQADAAKLLAAVAADVMRPAFARASALTELAPYLSPANDRAGAERAVGPRSDGADRRARHARKRPGQPKSGRLASPLLSDPSRGVRIRAASLLAAVPTANQPPADRERFERAAAEFIAAQRFNADRPESRAALGKLLCPTRPVAEAETEYKAALRLSPQYAPAAINLADLYRQTRPRQRRRKGAARRALLLRPQDAGLHHALGLALVRLKRPDEALDELRRAAELDPGEARYAYVYAVALHSAGRGGEAVAVLKDNLARHPNDRDTQSALVAFGREGGTAGSALEYPKQLDRMAPPAQ